MNVYAPNDDYIIYILKINRSITYIHNIAKRIIKRLKISYKKAIKIDLCDVKPKKKVRPLSAVNCTVTRSVNRAEFIIRYTI